MVGAPYLTMSLHRNLTAWKFRDPRGLTAGLKKVDLHAEYMAGRNVVLALASDKVSSAEKHAMATKLKDTPKDFP